MKEARERYSFIILVIISIFTSTVAAIVSFNHADNDGRVFCEVVNGFVATPVQEPADPAANPSREQDYLWYERFWRLDRKLGC